jgi:hypothetical protein
MLMRVPACRYDRPTSVFVAAAPPHVVVKLVGQLNAISTFAIVLVVQVTVGSNNSKPLPVFTTTAAQWYRVCR